MTGAGIDKQIETIGAKVKHSLGGHLLREPPSAQTMLGVFVLVQALRVVEEREQEDELRITAVDLCREPEPRPRHGLPVLLAMVT